MRSAPDRLLRRLEWQVVRRLDGRLQGAYRTAFRGVGIDFDSVREYNPQDDVRHIDWNVTARLDEPYVRQYTEDRELTAWLVLDRSASMHFGRSPNSEHSGRSPNSKHSGRSPNSKHSGRSPNSKHSGRSPNSKHSGRSPNSEHSGDGEQGKASVLTELAVCLARLFVHGGNRVGAILYDNRFQRVIPARTGRNHVLHLAHELTKPVPASRDAGTTDLDAMLRLAASTARRRSLVFVISDFIAEVDWEPALTRLSHRHEVVALRVVDPMELDLPDLGLVLVEDVETGEQLLADTSDPLFRRRLRAEVDAREQAVSGRMRRAGVAAHRIGTDQDLVEALVEMVRRSRRRRR